MMGVNIVGLIIQLIYPFILIFHGLSEFKKVAKKPKAMSTI
jgi:hypothetical protein